MSDSVHVPSRSAGLKTKAIHEAREFFGIFCYLFPVLSLFTFYSSLLGRAEGVPYVEYGFAFVQAFIGAKVILLCQNRAFVRKHEHRPLIYPTLYKSIVFLLLMTGFSILERLVKGQINHESLWTALSTGVHLYVLLAKDVVIFFCLIPFFAFREIERIQGEKSLYRLFLGSGPKGAAPGE